MTDATRVADTGSAGQKRWTLGIHQSGEDTALLRLAGRWRLEDALPGPDEVGSRLDANSAIRRIRFDTEGVTGWDSGLLVFLGKLVAESDRRRIDCDRSGLPDGVRRLLALASAVPERKDAREGGRRPSWLARLGIETLTATDQIRVTLTFLGEACLAFLKLLRGRARFRRADLLVILQECGAEALGIVTLISFLVGVILAYVGAVQLRQFGAQIYVADLVGIAMTREMGALIWSMMPPRPRPTWWNISATATSPSIPWNGYFPSYDDVFVRLIEKHRNDENG